MEFKDFLTGLQIIVTGYVGFAAWKLSRAQLEINRKKILFDLFSERYGVFTSLEKYLAQAVQNCNDIQSEAEYQFYIAMSKSKFIFGEEVHEYLESVRRSVLECQYFDKPAKAADREKAMKWIVAQLTESKDVFKPYLSVTVKDSQDDDGFYGLVCAVASRALEKVRSLCG